MPMPMLLVVSSGGLWTGDWGLGTCTQPTVRVDCPCKPLLIQTRDPGRQAGEADGPVEMSCSVLRGPMYSFLVRTIRAVKGFASPTQQKSICMWHGGLWPVGLRPVCMACANATMHFELRSYGHVVEALYYTMLSSYCIKKTALAHVGLS